jgi:hypothetical protein
MSRNQKSVGHVVACDSRVIVGLVVEVLVRFWPDYVTAFAHRVPVFFSRSSFPKAIIEAAVLLLPITGADFDCFPGVQTFEGKSFEFFHRGLVRVDQPFNVSGD